MTAAPRLAYFAMPLLIAAGLPSAGLALQQEPVTDSRTQADQIQAPASETARRERAGKAYLDIAREQPPEPRASLTQTPDDQIMRASGSAPTVQITSRTQGSPGIAQLSKADLNATLAQLSAAERRVLLQTIEGTDVCDNPPQVPAVIALCRDRIETRSQDFATQIQRPLSAEEQLLRGGLDMAVQPSFSQVIDRLARTNAATDDFSNQAIASIALAPPLAPSQPGGDQPDETEGLGEQTQALINAIINQLGGGAP